MVFSHGSKGKGDFLATEAHGKTRKKSFKSKTNESRLKPLPQAMHSSVGAASAAISFGFSSVFFRVLPWLKNSFGCFCFSFVDFVAKKI